MSSSPSYKVPPSSPVRSASNVPGPSTSSAAVASTSRPSTASTPLDMYEVAKQLARVGLDRLSELNEEPPEYPIRKGTIANWKEWKSVMLDVVNANTTDSMFMLSYDQCTPEQIRACRKFEEFIIRSLGARLARWARAVSQNLGDQWTFKAFWHNFVGLVECSLPRYQEVAVRHFLNLKFDDSKSFAEFWAEVRESTSLLHCRKIRLDSLVAMTVLAKAVRGVDAQIDRELDQFFPDEVGPPLYNELVMKLKDLFNDREDNNEEMLKKKRRPLCKRCGRRGDCTPEECRPTQAPCNICRGRTELALCIACDS